MLRIISLSSWKFLGHRQVGLFSRYYYVVTYLLMDWWLAWRTELSKFHNERDVVNIASSLGAIFGPIIANVNRWHCSRRHAKIFVWIYPGCNVSCQVSADKWLAYSTEWQLMTPSNCLEVLGLWLLSSPHLWPNARIRGWMTLTNNFGPDLLLLFKVHRLWSVDSQGNY